MLKQASFLLALLLSVNSAISGDYTGQYSKLSRPVDTGVGADRVEVLFFFAYSCKPCMEFEPKLQKWLADNKKSVVFQRVPSTFVPEGKGQARVYYTAKEFKAGPKLHEGLYKKIQNHQLVLDRNDLLANFIGSRLAKDPFRVEAVMDSISINSALLYAADLSNKYRMARMPAFIVNGRYITYLEQAGGGDELLEVLDYLVGLEKQAYRYQAW